MMPVIASGLIAAPLEPCHGISLQLIEVSLVSTPLLFAA